MSKIDKITSIVWGTLVGTILVILAIWGTFYMFVIIKYFLGF